MFDQQQIIEFKEAFSIMDADHDGFVCAEDLEEVFQQLGRSEASCSKGRWGEVRQQDF